MKTRIGRRVFPDIIYNTIEATPKVNQSIQDNYVIKFKMLLLLCAIAVTTQAQNDKSNAIDAQQKAILALKNKEDFSASEMAAFESLLQQYKNT
jgi:hypothetical protein